MSLRISGFAARIIAPLVALAAAAAFTWPAHADDQSFLNDLRASGMPVMYEPYYVGSATKSALRFKRG